MELSLSVEYFLNQIKNQDDKDFFILYYNNFQKHLEYAKQYIKLKKILENSITDLLDIKLTNADEINIYTNLNNNIRNSIKIVENDAMNYKENFKKHLFYLIKK